MYGYQPRKTPPSHTIIRDGDEYYCPKCGKRWGIKEPVPQTCTQHPPIKP